MSQILVVERQTQIFYKDPDEVRDCPVDWSLDLPAGVTVVDSIFLPDDPTLVVDSDTYDSSGTVARLSGGTTGTRVWVTNRVTLSDGQVHDFRFKVIVRER